MKIHTQKGEKVFTIKLSELVIAGVFIGAGYFATGLYYDQQSQTSYDTGFAAGVASKTSANQAKLDNCLDVNENNYRLTIEATKKSIGISPEEGLPKDSADHIESQYVDRKDTCLRQYPAN